MPEAAYCVWIVSPPRYPHSRCFDEVALALSEAFADLGYDAPVVRHAADVRGVPVVLGPHLLPRSGEAAPPGAILYNLEQAYQGSEWLTQDYLALLRTHPVWDYSARNLQTLAGMGVSAALCGVGYSPGLTRIPPAPEQDVDVLFVGSLPPRRAAVIEALRARGARVGHGFNVYGPERDAFIARSKVLLNLHQHETQVFEIVRVSYLLANRACVVSEVGLDAELEAPFRAGVAFCAYDELVDTCLRLLADPGERARLAQAGFAGFTARPQAEMLRRALGGGG